MTDELQPRNFVARVEGVFVVQSEAVESTPKEELKLTYAGVVGDRHEGLVRPSGAREPWYPRGTRMRNERQLSILSLEELAEVAAALKLPKLPAEWIGANLALSGIADFSKLPPRTLLMFPSGATIRIDGDNGPCRISGRSIMEHHPDRADVEFGFVHAAKGKRGLVGWVEREGAIRVGDEVKVRTWRQAIYAAAG
jgi:hypothetical protein